MKSPVLSVDDGDLLAAVTEKGKKVAKQLLKQDVNFNWKCSGFVSCPPLSLSASDTHRVCYSSCQWGVHRARKRGAEEESDLPNALFGLAQQHGPVEGHERDHT